jgi:hypothetical protein
MREKIVASKINCLGWSRNVRRQKSMKARTKIGQPTNKPLSERYAEVVRLRQAVLRTQSELKSAQTDRRVSE